MATPGTTVAPYLAQTTQLANENIDTWIPAGRTTANVPAYLANNAVFNVLDYGVAGVSPAVDAPAMQAAVNAAGALNGDSGRMFGGTVLVPAGTPVQLGNTSILIPAGVQIVGEGSRASDIVYTGTGYGLDFGGSGSALYYGCGIREIAIHVDNATGTGIRARGTAEFYMSDIYMEGLDDSTPNGIFLDGGNAANIFSQIRNVTCNHMGGVAFSIGSTGTLYCTTFEMIGLRVLGDGTGTGIKIRPGSPYSMRFSGGNIEDCAIGIDHSGFGCVFEGLRFESNTLDVLLNAGAQTNTFAYCNGLNTLTDNSGLYNTYFQNYNTSYVLFPNNTVTSFTSLVSAGSVMAATSLIFGGGLSSLSRGNTGSIANGATYTTPLVGHCFKLILTESGNDTAAEFLLTPIAGQVSTLGTTSAPTLWSDTIGTSGKINVSVSSGNLQVQNMTGAAATIQYAVLQVEP
jgi:hypothetical protein